MSNEQAELLFEELLQLRLELAELRKEAKANTRLLCAPHYVAAGFGVLVLVGAFAFYAVGLF
jgi:hypothetical protein